jgi:hypothetical protein
MKTLAPFFLFFCVTLQAQVGIGTTTPQATLDITGQPGVSTELDGVIAPRLTGDQLRAKTYTATQTAAIVYVTTADTAPAGQTIDVTQIGYYYFDGTIWVAMAPQSDDWTITGNSNTSSATNFIGTTDNIDLIFKRNSVQSGWLSANTTAFGVNSIDPSTNTGVHNTAIGYTSLLGNTSGHRNTSIGSGTMSINTTGYQNTAIGRYTMHFNTSGYNNMAIGQEAAKWNSTGSDNAAIGFNALRYNGTGSYNVAIGRSALAYNSLGTDTLEDVGDNNIAIGANAQIPTNSSSNQLVLGGAPGSSIGATSTATTRTIINGIVNSAAGAPSGDSDSGVAGEIRVDTQGGTRYLYICYATDSWGRVALDTSF